MAELSVIIPVYNTEKYLRKCLDSIVNQTFTDMEIILVDDGSTDNSKAICDEYAGKDDRIIVIHKKNGGVSAARNDGIVKAQGKWLAFVDADDWYETDYYGRLFYEMGKRGGVNDIDVFISGGRYVEYIDRQVIISTGNKVFYYKDRESVDMLMVKLLVQKNNKRGSNYKMTGSPCDKIYRTDFIKRNGLMYDMELNIGEDALFNFQVLNKAEKVANCLYIGYHYNRMVTASATRKYSKEREDNNYAYISKLYGCMEKRGISETMQKALYVTTITNIRSAISHCYFHPDNKEPYKEKVKKIRQMKKRKYFAAAIKSTHNELFTKRQKIVQIILRMPMVWPLYVVIKYREKFLNI